ncbi:MAG: hypothetical protein Q8867_03285 [Bacteroidota bacterium]|nr:hypothetical protein [Bacteroidota bacterium]
MPHNQTPSMKKLQKRLIIILSAVILCAIIVIAGVKYIPVRKLLHISAPPEKDFVNLKQNSNEAPDALFFDMEIDPTKSQSNKFYKGIAHSGQYSAKAFGKNTYSFSVERKVSDICKGKKLDAVSMSTWVYSFPGKNEPWGAFVFAVNNSMGVNICWKGIQVSGKQVPRGKWFKISGMFDLSDIKIDPSCTIQIYFWNNSNTDFLVDDYYIVFGKQQERKGDTTITDMTRDPVFHSKFNTPPYPVFYFEKQESGNENAALVSNQILQGHFISSQGGREDIFLGGGNSPARLLSYCSGEFTEVKLNIPAEISSCLRSGNAITGCFQNSGNSMILFSGDKGSFLAGFEKSGNPCSGKEATMKIVWRSAGKDPFGKGKIVACDIDNNRITEILSIANDGSWKIFRYSGGQNGNWKVISSSQIVDFWNNKDQLSVISGRFLQKYSYDVLLTIFKDKGSRVYQYSLLRFDAASGRFLPCFAEKRKGFGRTVGIDTLKPGDIFFTGIFDKSGTPKVLRYNRDWRYDLKEIRFNDTTFQVISNIDFKGYDRDHNPKYYESLRILSGQFLEPGINTLFLVAKNKKTVTYLPDAAGTYSWRKEK